MKDLKIIKSGLFQKKLQTALLLFAIFIAFMIFGILTSFYVGFKQAGSAENRLIVLNRINFSHALPIAYRARIAAVDGVAGITHSTWVGGYFREAKNRMITFAVDAETYMRMFERDVIIPDGDARSWMATRNGIAVGRLLAEKYGWSVGDRVPLSSYIWLNRDGGRVYDTVISAIYDATENSPPANQILMHYRYFNEARVSLRDTVSMYFVRTRDPAVNGTVSTTVDTLFVNSASQTKTQDIGAFTRAFIDQIGNIGQIIIGTTAVALVTILMIVSNAMAGAIRDRTADIAILKTVGFTDGRIGRIMLGETLTLSIVGGTLGLGAAYFATRAMDVQLTIGGKIAMTLPVVLQGVAIMIALGLVTGLPPAVGAMRISVIRALGRG